MLTQAELVELLAEVAKGDSGAFERLYGATRAKLYGVLLRILGRPELADEVMQETYLKVWKSAASFDPAIPSPIILVFDDLHTAQDESLELLSYLIESLRARLGPEDT